METNIKKSLRIIALLLGFGVMVLMWPIFTFVLGKGVGVIGGFFSYLGVGVVWDSAVGYLAWLIPIGRLWEWVGLDGLGWSRAVGYGLLGIVILFVVGRIWFAEKPRYVRYDKMPAMRPIPIKTKNVRWPRNLMRWILDSRQWELTEDWECFLGDTKIIIRADEHFVFDGASIPRPLWFLLSPIGLLLMPGLLHDYGYRYDKLHRLDEYQDPSDIPYHEGAGKLYWDRLFLRAAVDINGFRMLNTLASYAVVLGGYFAWWSRRGETWKSWLLGGGILGVVALSLWCPCGLPIALLIVALMLMAVVILIRFEFFTPL